MRILLKPAVAVAFVALCAFSSWIYLHSRRPAIGPSTAPQLEKAPDNETSPSSPGSRDAQGDKETEPPPKESGQPDTRTEQASPPPRPAEEGTRGAVARPASRMMLDIRRVYVDPLGDDAYNKQLREELINGLRSSARFQVVANRDDADAVFRPSERHGAASEFASPMGLDLVNGRGQVVWSIKLSPGAKRIPRDPARASAAILRALLLDVSRLEKK